VANLDAQLLAKASEMAPRRWLYEDIVGLVDNVHNSLGKHQANVWKRDRGDVKPFPRGNDESKVLDVLPRPANDTTSNNIKSVATTDGTVFQAFSAATECDYQLNCDDVGSDPFADF
jgi:hypothetical protein